MFFLYWCLITGYKILERMDFYYFVMFFLFILIWVDVLFILMLNYRLWGLRKNGFLWYCFNLGISSTIWVTLFSAHTLTRDVITHLQCLYVFLYGCASHLFSSYFTNLFSFYKFSSNALRGIFFLVLSLLIFYGFQINQSLSFGYMWK